MRTSNRLRKTTGVTAAVMAASSWVGLSGASRNADAIVSLSDEAMAQVSGGQMDPIDYTCKAATIGTNVLRLGDIPISVPLNVTTVCSAYWVQTHIIEPYFYAPTFQTVYTGFLIMAGYQQNMIEVNGAFQCDPYDPNCATPTFYSSTVENLDTYYCGGANCWCDYDDDCWGQWCDWNGFCVS